jgi:hypothetical protein
VEAAHGKAEHVKKLTHEAQARAKAFIYEQGRPLEQRLYAYYFEKGTAEDVLTELARFQNTDGGFGNGLEPDLRLPDSSVITTTVGLQVLRDLGALEDHPLVRGAMRYLLETYDPEIEAWPIIPPNVDDAPHAPWWAYSENLAEGWGGFLANPRAEIVGYLYDYAGLVPKELLEHLSDAALSHLASMPDRIEMHDLLCYLRLIETRTLPDKARDKILCKLTKAVNLVVDRDPSSWGSYGIKPLDVATSPDSPLAEMLADEIELNLDYAIDQQQPDGSWAPTWSWGDAYSKAWEEAKREWSGHLTVRTLKVLQNFGRLDKSLR